MEPLEIFGKIIEVIIIPLVKPIIRSVCGISETGSVCRQWNKRRQDKGFERYRIWLHQRSERAPQASLMSDYRKAFGKVRLPSDEPTTIWI